VVVAWLVQALLVEYRLDVVVLELPSPIPVSFHMPSHLSLRTNKCYTVNFFLKISTTTLILLYVIIYPFTVKERTVPLATHNLHVKTTTVLLNKGLVAHNV